MPRLTPLHDLPTLPSDGVLAGPIFGARRLTGCEAPWMLEWCARADDRSTRAAVTASVGRDRHGLGAFSMELACELGIVAGG